jgi:hypothetical protein
MHQRRRQIPFLLFYHITGTFFALRCCKSCKALPFPSAFSVTVLHIIVLLSVVWWNEKDGTNRKTNRKCCTNAIYIYLSSQKRRNKLFLHMHSNQIIDKSLVLRVRSCGQPSFILFVRFGIVALIPAANFDSFQQHATLDLRD